MISRARSSNFGLGCGSCTHLTVTFSCSILVLHGLSEPSGWPTAGRLEVNKCTVFCRNIKRNIKRYWISRRICRSISCSVARAAGGRRGIVPTSAGRAGGLSGAALVPVVGGRRYAAGRPGSGARSPTPGRLPPPNNALERTGHNGHHVADVGWFGVARRSPGALGAAPVHTRKEESTGRRSRCCIDQPLEGRFPCVPHARDRSVG